jgi:hypothetical protein
MTAFRPYEQQQQGEDEEVVMTVSERGRVGKELDKRRQPRFICRQPSCCDRLVFRADGDFTGSWSKSAKHGTSVVHDILVVMVT